MNKRSDKYLAPLNEKLSADFNLPVKGDGYDEIKRLLAERVKRLLETNPELLMNNLYRIDVNEGKVQEVLHGKLSDTEASERLADLIIERQLLRIKTQVLYKEGKL